MTDWIDFAVYATFLVALFFVQPATQQRLTIPMLIDRNAEWAAAHPDLVRRIAGVRWRLWLSYALGAISLAVLASFQLGLWTAPSDRGGTIPPKWMILWLLSMAAMIAAMVIGGAIGIQGYVAFRRLVPIAPRRQATLERRSLDDFVPRGIQLAAYSLNLVTLAAWVAAGIAGTHSSPVFWQRVTILFVLSGFFFVVAQAMVARRANAMDRVIGPAYRRWEMRWVFSTLFLPPVIGAVRLYEEVTGTLLLDVGRAMQLLLAGYLAYILLRTAAFVRGGSTAHPMTARQQADAA